MAGTARAWNMQTNTAHGLARRTWLKRAASAMLYLLAVTLVIGFVLIFAQAVTNSATHWHQDPGPAAWHFPR